jgi:hypothetical protein
VKDPAATPLVPRKRGRPLGSHNKRTLAALAAAAPTESAGAVPSAAIIVVPTEAVVTAAATAMATAGAVVTAAATATAPAGAASTTGLAVTPLEAAATIIGTAVSFGAAPPSFTGIDAGGSTSGAATVVYKPWRPPVR